MDGEHESHEFPPWLKKELTYPIISRQLVTGGWSTINGKDSLRIPIE